MNIPIFPHDFGSEMLVEIPFATAANESQSGITGRKSTRDIPLRIYTVTVNPTVAIEAKNILLANRGARWPFALRDYADNYTLTDETQTVAASAYYGISYCNLYRKFTPATGTRTFSQRVLIIDQSEVAFTVKINGVPATNSPQLWHIEDPGILVINESLGGSDTVTVSGQYLIPCVFVDDSLSMTIHVAQSPGLFSIGSLRLREIPEQELIELTA